MLSAAIVALGLTTLGAAPPAAVLRGFSAQSSVRERTVDSEFVDLPSVQSALDAARTIAARAHYAGTPGDYGLAVFMRDQLRKAGLTAELESFRARVDTPRELVVEFSPPDGAGRGRRHKASVALDLAERGQPGDPPTNDRGIGLPFNAGSADGDVRAPLTYVNRGLEADYATLTQAGLDVRGSIVLVRYGAEFRGLLAQRAQRHGASGAIFYSDPSDDGFVRGPAVPDGPWRPATSVERGPVGRDITIPTLPVAAPNAQILLASLRGSAAPAGWTGGLPVAYPLARSAQPIHLIVKLNRQTTTLWNTVGIVPGLRADQQVLLGAQRDAPVYGVGIGAGITTLLEVARGFGFLLRGGWQPQRSIVIAGWDGEANGSAGLEAYERRHRIQIERGCIAYLDTARDVTGPAVQITGAPAIVPLIADAARSVSDPATPSATLFDRLPAAQIARSNGAARGDEDRAAFLLTAGVPNANIRFEGPFGVDNSSYDTLRYALRFSDPGFGLHRAAAQLYGLVALHLADADAVPYTFGGYADLVRSAVGRMTPRNEQDPTAAGVTELARSAKRFAGAAARMDARIEAADGSASEREVQAVRLLNALLFATADRAQSGFREIDAARPTRSPAVAAAIDRTAQTLVHAAALLDGS